MPDEFLNVKREGRPSPLPFFVAREYGHGGHRTPHVRAATKGRGGGWLGRQALFHLGYTQELDTSDQPGQLTWLKLQQASLLDRLDCLLTLPVCEASAPFFQLSGSFLVRCAFLPHLSVHIE